MEKMHEIESVFMSGHSLLEVICGPMFSGKTEELIRRIRRVEYARMRAIVFKPEIDARYSEDLVVSHSDQKMGSIPVSNVLHIKDYLGKSQTAFQVIGFDEVQFFDENIVALSEELVNAGIRVIAAGLSEDYLGRPFGVMPNLLAHADSITKLWAVCMRCGLPASKSQRINREEKAIEKEQILVGASRYYEARCRSCFVPAVVDLPKNDPIDLGRSYV